MSYVTVINCISGRTQLPVNAWLRKRYGVDWVDTVTEAAPAAVLADEPESAQGDCISARVHLSLDTHGSDVLALVAHHGCTANPVRDADQQAQVRAGVKQLGRWFPEADVIGLWVDEQTQVHQI